MASSTTCISGFDGHFSILMSDVNGQKMALFNVCSFSSAHFNFMYNSCATIEINSFRSMPWGDLRVFLSFVANNVSVLYGHDNLVAPRVELHLRIDLLIFSPNWRSQQTEMQTWLCHFAHCQGTLHILHSMFSTKNENNRINISHSLHFSQSN